MTDNNKLSKLGLSILTAALATGIASASNTTLAEDGNVSEKDMLVQAVALYEKLSCDTVNVPRALVDNFNDENLGKAVMLGFTSSDKVSEVSDTVAIRKQDALTILYKTIISYDYSYALTSGEIDEIMNTCYDNAFVDEENRAAYAFMLKHGIITDTYDTEPNKIITWSSCSTLVDVLYDLFVQDVSFTIGNGTVKIGTSIEAVTDVFGEPSRIDKSDYDFSWYVYNQDPSYFMMVGVKEGRVCSFFTNNSSFSFGDIEAGDDYLFAYKYMENDDFRIFKNSDGMIDAVLYNPYTKSDVTLDNSTYLRSCELVDIINAYRSKHGYDILNIDNDLYATANSMVTQAKYQELARDARYSHTMDDAQHEEGYDIFAIYEKLIGTDSECFNEDVKSIGISTFADESFNIYTSLVCSGAQSALTTEPADIETIEPDSFMFETAVATAANTDEATDTEEFVFETEAEVSEIPSAAPSAPVIAAPMNEAVITAGDDLTIELAEDTADEYYVSIYSIEDDEYIVNSYIKTSDTKLTFTADLFTIGKDYAVSVSAANSVGTSDAAAFTVRYGLVPDDAVTLDLADSEIVTDNDYIDVKWTTELYSNFVLDVYNTDGQLMLSEIITDIDNVTINNVDPGEYYIYLTALREGTEDVFKAQAMTKATVTLPEPVVTEHILDAGGKFYPVYEDAEMGLLYFYDEEIIEVTEVASNGRITNIKKKKITEKQVKDVGYYRSLAMTRGQVEYFDGSLTLNSKQYDSSLYTYSGTKMSIYDETIGDAIITEVKKYLGVPYVWGGTTPDGFDCSGLVQYVYRNLGIELNRVSQDQYKQGMHLTRDELMPGDLVFFRDETGDVHHVGIYAGDGQMIHAPYTGAVVSYQSIDTQYYKSQFCGGRRVY